MVSRESMTVPLPHRWQKESDYSTPAALLQALADGQDGDLRRARASSMRCDIYMLAAICRALLPDEGRDGAGKRPRNAGETYERQRRLILTMREHHDRDAPQTHPQRN